MQPLEQNINVSQNVKHEQQIEEVKDWCTRENVNDGTPKTCTCGVENPQWVAKQALNKGHRARIDVERDTEGKVRKVLVKDFFMPDNGDMFSGFANEHAYYSSLSACRGQQDQSKNAKGETSQAITPTQKEDEKISRAPESIAGSETYWHNKKPLYIYTQGDAACFKSESGMILAPWGNAERVTESIVENRDHKSMTLIGTYENGGISKIHHFTSASDCATALKVAN